MSGFGIIFDLNGTLVDTDSAYFLAYKDVLQKYGIPFTLEDFTAHWSIRGKKLDEYLKTINREDLLPKWEDMVTEKEAIFHDTIGERVKQMDGARDIVEMLQEAGIRTGLDSSTTKESIEHTLDCVGLGSLFHDISSWDMDLDEAKYGSRKKKESRLRALGDRMGISAARMIVIGDAEKDLVGAKHAGMKAIAVPNDYTKDTDFSLADACFGALGDISLADLENLVE